MKVTMAMTKTVTVTVTLPATLRLHARSCCKKQKQTKLNPNTLDPVQQKDTN